MMKHSRDPAPSVAGHVDKPTLPGINTESVRAQTNDHETPTASSSGLQLDLARTVSHSRGRIPQFRQSRRWARMHGWAEPPTPPILLQGRDSFLDNNPTTDDVRNQQLSKREVSFDQQRALPKPTIAQPHVPVKQPERPNNNRGDSESTSARISTAKCWRVVKPNTTRLPRPSTKVWPRTRSKSRNATSARRSNSRSRVSIRVVALLTGLRTENKVKGSKHSSIYNETINASVADGEATLISNTRTLRRNQGRPRMNRTTSLLPSLHDPVKDSTFSEECRRMLAAFESGKDWLQPVAHDQDAFVEGASSSKINHPEVPHLGSAGTGKQVSPEDCLPPHPVPEAPNSSASACSAPATAAWQHTAAATEKPRIMLDCRLPSILETGQGPSESLHRIPINHLEPKDQDFDHVHTLSAIRPNQTPIVTRLPSARSVMSTDTLTGIEAQVRGKCDHGAQTVTPRMSTERSVVSPINRRSGPAPDIPLPAVPTEAEDARSDATSGSTDSRSMGLHRKESSATSAEFARHSIQGPRAENVHMRRLRDLAKSRSQSPGCGVWKDAKTLLRLTPPRDPVLLMPVSEISDDLDRFPAAPDSRPTSTGSMSVRSAHKRQTSPGKPDLHQLRRTSTTNSTSHRPSCRHQILSQSNIFVVVDSDPVTAQFRAGVMSPSPSIGGSSPGRQSTTHAFQPRQLRDMTEYQANPLETFDLSTSPRSPEGVQILTPGQSSSCSTKRPATGDRRHNSSSGDEHSFQSPSATSPKKTPARSKKRRRWNSGDINSINLMQRDLENYCALIRQQEKRIKWQAHQIQMMARVLAPMSRVRGVKAPGPLQESPDLPPMQVERQRLEPLKRKSWSGTKDWRQRDIAARSPLDVIEEQTLNSQERRDEHGEVARRGHSITKMVLSPSNKAAGLDASHSSSLVHEHVVESESVIK